MMKFLAPYQRMTSTGRYIAELDGLRCLAIGSVFFYHLAGDVLRHGGNPAIGTVFSVTQVLNVGVPLFFVISGFILGLPFARAWADRRDMALKKYFWRRVTRLEPPYILALLLFFVAKIMASKGTVAALFPHLAASMAYLHNQVYGRPSDIEFVAWSLEVEVQFYVVAPLLGCVFAIRDPLVRRSIIVWAILITTSVSALVAGYPRGNLSLLGSFQYFLAGFLLVEVYRAGGCSVATNKWDGARGGRGESRLNSFDKRFFVEIEFGQPVPRFPRFGIYFRCRTNPPTS